MARILLVDDDMSVRTVFTLLLERLGHEVEAFDDARPAMAANLDHADLVITDLAMPTRGELLIEAIRAQRRALPILVVSGHLEERSQVALEALGANQILAKPCTTTALASAVDRWLGWAN